MMTRESGILLLVSAFIGAFGAALLSAGVGLNFATIAVIAILIIYILKTSPRKDIVYGIVGLIIGVLLQVLTPIKMPIDNQAVLTGFMLLSTLQN